MPNHITNFVRVRGLNADTIMKKYFTDTDGECLLDFFKIIPMPKSVNDEYTWCCNNWGTKWNAYTSQKTTHIYDYFRFETAWTSPVPIITKLSKLEPLLTFSVDYADEDVGSNCGSYTYIDGELITHLKFSTCTKISVRFAMNILELSQKDTEEFYETLPQYK